MRTEHGYRDANVTQEKFDEYALTFQLKRPFDFFKGHCRYKFAGKILEEKKVILDIGCGEGWGTHFLKDICRNAHVIGIDVDTRCIEFLKKHNYKDIEVVQSNFLDYKPTRVIDGFVSLDVIEHLSHEEADKFLDKVSKLLPATGQLVLGTPSINSAQYASKNRSEGHDHEYTPKEYKALLGRHFKKVNVFSMTDEAVNTSFIELAWYLMAVCSN